MVSEKYQIEVADFDYYRGVISCQNACPVHTDAQGYVNAIASQDYEDGYIMARQPNPFASTCGRVCNAPCEAACRRGNIDAPVSIRALKRFLCERYGAESSEHIVLAKSPAEGWGAQLQVRHIPGNSGTQQSVSTMLRASERKPIEKRAKVAIIGAGPAGMTAAYDLSALGYEVTVLEAWSSAGGMLLLGIPEYRLPRSLVGMEIDDIVRQGVEFKINMRLGKDFLIRTLRAAGYEAIFLATGAYVDQRLGIEGEDLDGVIYSMDFLREANLGRKVEIGNRILVIGGGGTAMDAARTMLRIGEGSVEKDGVAAMDAARGALRLGARQVQIIYRGTRWEMRAPDEEVEDALQEGVNLHTSRAPKRILGDNGRVTGIETVRMQSTIDEHGRRVRTFIPDSEEMFRGDTVIVAIGQKSDLTFIMRDDGIHVTDEGTILVDHETLATTAPGVFAGGDVAFGPRIIIDAVRDGHKAARSIDRYLQKGGVSVICNATFRDVTPHELPAEGWLEIPRQRPPLYPVERRTGISEVELVYDENTAIEQASRCLRCHIQTIFNGDLCILCGGCVDICPWSCLKMVRLDKLAGDQRVEAVVQARYGIPLASFQTDEAVSGKGTAMIKDETRCTRCGLCAKRCPTGAITMEAFQFREELVYEKGSGSEV